MSIAFLIIDMQKEFIENNKYRDFMESALEYINETSRIFREARLPVVIIQDEEAGEGPGSSGFELVDELIVEESDYHLTKFYSNAFCKTDLEKLLKNLDVDFVFVSGFAAEHCVLFSYNGARELGFGASILQNGVAGCEKEQIEKIQLLRSVTSIETIEYFISK